MINKKRRIMVEVTEGELTKLQGGIISADDILDYLTNEDKLIIESSDDVYKEKAHINGSRDCGTIIGPSGEKCHATMDYTIQFVLKYEPIKGE